MVYLYMVDGLLELKGYRNFFVIFLLILKREVVIEILSIGAAKLSIHQRLTVSCIYITIYILRWCNNT